LEFSFGLKPIVQIMVWLFAAFEIDFVCATSDVLVTRRFPAEASGVSAWVEAACGFALSFLIGLDDILISPFLVTGLLLIVEACYGDQFLICALHLVAPFLCFSSD
jgi:hypothetical protein